MKEFDNILIVRNIANNYFFWHINWVHIEELLKHRYDPNSIMWYIYRFFLIFRIPVLKYFAWKWQYDLTKYKTVLFFDDGFHENFAKFCKKRNKNIKVILLFWNPLNKWSIKLISSKYIDEIYTYNKDDLIKDWSWKLKYIPWFYTKNIKLDKWKIVNDVLFLGRAKNRKNQILEFEKKLNDKNIITNFKIIEKESDYITYDDYLDLVSHTKCLLDYNYPIISWLTLRIIEWLFFEKKVITNNYNVIKCDYYNQKNIFIIGLDDIKDINQFINSPYEKVDKGIVDKYDFYSWLRRFI